MGGRDDEDDRRFGPASAGLEHGADPVAEQAAVQAGRFAAGEEYRLDGERAVRDPQPGVREQAPEALHAKPERSAQAVSVVPVGAEGIGRGVKVGYGGWTAVGPGLAQVLEPAN